MTVLQTHTLKLIAVFSVLLLVSLWLLLVVQLPGDSKVIYELQDSGHIVIFCVLTFGFAFSLNKFYFKASARHALVCAFILGFLFSGGSEFIQPWFGRDSSWGDLLKDFLGVLAGLLLYVAYITSGLVRFFAAICTLIIIFYGLSSPVTWYYAKEKRDAQFPLLGDFENAWTSRFFERRYHGKFTRARAPETWLSNQTMVAKVDFHPGSWPGLAAFDLRGNWGQYDNFIFEVFNPHNEMLELTVRIHDALHNHQHDDRFNVTLKLAPGESVISLPIEKIRNTRSGRELQMGKIRVLMLYMTRPGADYTLYFDNFRLE